MLINRMSIARVLCLMMVGCLILVPAAPAAAEHKTATWEGAADDDYNNPGNWDIGEVPINTIDHTYTVVIPAAMTVDFNVLGSGHQVTQLSLAAGSTLNINSGRDLQVLDAAAVGGVVTTNNSVFLANHAASTLDGTAARLLAAGGATMTHAGTSLVHTSVKNGAVLSADGAGTTLAAPNLQSFSSTQNPYGANVRRIEAINFGALDLSALQTITGPAGDDRVEIITTGGGTINLSSLQNLYGSTRFTTDASTLSLNTITSAENLTFGLPVGATVDLNNLITQTSGAYDLPAGATFNLPSLTTLNNAVVTMSDATSAFNAPGLTDIDHSRFLLSGGASLTINAQPTYTLNNLGNTTVVSSDGASVLDLSTVQTIVSTQNPYGANARLFTAGNGGQIDFSGLLAVTGPGGDDRVEFKTLTGGTIDLSALAMTTGNVKFVTDAPTYTLASLANAGAITFDLNAGAVLSLPELATQNGGGYAVPANGAVEAPKLTSLQNASLALDAGGVFNAPLLTDISGTAVTLRPNQTLNTAALNVIDNARLFAYGGVTLAVTDGDYTNSQLSSGDMFSADGAGTNLDLSTVASITSTQNPYGAHRRNIHATAGGAIDLSGLTTITAPGGDDRIDFISNTGGTIDLSNLQTTTTGNVHFATDQPSFTLPRLAHASAITFDTPDHGVLTLPELLDQVGGGYNVPVAATFDLPKLTDLTSATVIISDPAAAFAAPKVTNIDNTRITLTNGATLALKPISYDARGVGHTSIFSVSDTGTVLDLSTLTSLNANTNPYGANRRTILATNNARINLSSLQSVQGSTGDDRLDFVATSGGSIDLSVLQTFVSGNTRIAAIDGGMIALGDVTISSALVFEAAGNTSRISTGVLHLDPSASLAVTEGAVLEIAGNFSHELTSEAAFDADTAIFNCIAASTQWFEVAGADLGNVAAAENFGLAQLVVGDAAAATQVVLTDLIDNGNRSSSEALYLLGSGGLDGLQLLGGSMLVIGDIPVYALIDGAMVDLHSLFAPGETFIRFDERGSDGFIAIPEPATLSLLMLGGLAIVRRRKHGAV